MKTKSIYPPLSTLYYFILCFNEKSECPYLLKKTVDITDKLGDRIFQSEHNDFPHPFDPPYPRYLIFL